MSTQLDSIYDALAAMPITANGGAVTTKNYDQMPNQVATASGQLRLLLPIGQGEQPDEFLVKTFVAGANEVTWTIRDLYLYKPAGQGRGLGEHGGAVMAYIIAYVNALVATGGKFGRGVIEGTSMLTGTFEFPQQSGSWYAGVMITHTVREAGV